MGFFGFDEPEQDEAENWDEANAAFRAARKVARAWQPDARTALTETGEYPPAHVNTEGEWEVYFWSPGAAKGLLVYLDTSLEVIRQEEWGVFYREVVARVGAEILAPSGFQFVPEVGQPGPENLSFVFRRPARNGQNEFIDLQISTSVMLTPPPRRFTINLVRNGGGYPLFGAGGGFETRLGAVLPQPRPDFWWAFRGEAEYESQVREAFQLALEYGLPALA